MKLRHHEEFAAMTKKAKFAAGMVLFQRRVDGPYFLLLRNAQHGTWGFPKGHRNEHESQEACARRELAEETNLTDIQFIPGFLVEQRYLVRYRETETVFEKIVHYFLAELGSGHFERSSEHNEGGWYSLDSARSRLQHDELKELLAKAQSKIEENSSS